MYACSVFGRSFLSFLKTLQLKVPYTSSEASSSTRSSFYDGEILSSLPHELIFESFKQKPFSLSSGFWRYHFPLFPTLFCARLLRSRLIIVLLWFLPLPTPGTNPETPEKGGRRNCGESATPLPPPPITYTPRWKNHILQYFALHTAFWEHL